MQAFSSNTISYLTMYFRMDKTALLPLTYAFLPCSLPTPDSYSPSKLLLSSQLATLLLNYISGKAISFLFNFVVVHYRGDKIRGGGSGGFSPFFPTCHTLELRETNFFPLQIHMVSLSPSPSTPLACPVPMDLSIAHI